MADPSIRLDKWLWHARVVKTRTLARKLVEAGKVRVNRMKVTAPGRTVRPGDVLTIATQRTVLVYEIADIANRRGPYAEASLLYRDLSAPGPEPGAAALAAADRVPRPDKRQRRALTQWRGKPI